MAKRKRLTLPDPARLTEAPLETKTMFPLGVARHSAPIADVARDSSANAALEEMTHSWSAARADGRLVVALPHNQIILDHLQRDRVVVDTEQMASLKQSLSERGQQTPIEVVALPGGAGYGLLSGWRRCQAVHALYEETGEDRFATVQALLKRPSDASDAYRTMVEENEIRANLSHYERARIVIKAVEAEIFDTEKEALAALFGTVPRARRSKIRSFLTLVQALDGVIHFPEKISERAGLDLVQKLQGDTALGPRLRAALERAAPVDAIGERAVIAAAVQQKGNNSEKSLNKHSGTESTAQPETLAELSGLCLRRSRNGALVLSGPAVTEGLTQALVEWLAQQESE